MYKGAVFHLLHRLHDRYGADALALSGGCAMNSVANGKIYRSTPFKRMYVQAAAGDAGGAIGAAMVAWRDLRRSSPRSRMQHAYWGPEFSDEHIGAVLQDKSDALADDKCTIRKVN